MGKVYIGVMGVEGYKLWGVEWFGGDAVICGRWKIGGRQRQGGGRHICRPYGVNG